MKNEAEQPNLITEPATWASEAVSKGYKILQAFLPDLLHAVVLLMIGLLGAWLIKAMILRFGRGLDRLMSTLDRGRSESTPGPKLSITGIVARGAFWIVITLSIIGATEAMGMKALANWLQSLLGYITHSPCLQHPDSHAVSFGEMEFPIHARNMHRHTIAG